MCVYVHIYIYEKRESEEEEKDINASDWVATTGIDIRYGIGCLVRGNVANSAINYVVGGYQYPRSE